MKIIYSVLAAFTLAVAPSGFAASPISSAIFDAANGHSYYLLSFDTWSNSEAEAVTLGGHLVTINDAAEQSFVYNTFSTYGGTNHNLWIGLSDPSNTGNYAWSSGAPITYTDWSPGEPNNYGGVEHYGMVWGPPDTRANQWNDIQNNGIGGDGSVWDPNGVVEVVPEPSSAVLILVGGLCVLRRNR
jgi:hypothetical protein